MSQMHPVYRAKMVAFILHESEREAYEIEHSMKAAENEAKHGKKPSGGSYSEMMRSLH